MLFSFFAVFILLIFFILISTLANPNVIKTNLPRGKSDTKMRQSVTVGLNKDGKLFMGQMPISFAQLDSVVKIEADKVTLESRDAGNLGQLTKEELISKLLEEIKNKK